MCLKKCNLTESTKENYRQFGVLPIRYLHKLKWCIYTRTFHKIKIILIKKNSEIMILFDIPINLLFSFL